MKKGRLPSLTKQIGTITLILSLALAVPVSAQIRVSNLFPSVAAASSSSKLPKAVKIVGFVPLQGQATTRMYTRYEYGRIYLYIEHGSQPLTVVDITKKRHPQLVAREPGSIEPARYEQLWEGGSIQVSPLFDVSEGFDNQGRRGISSSLKTSDPADGTLLLAFGQNYKNLVDPDRRLVDFASPRYLFVVEDSRRTTIDFMSD